MSEPTSRGCRCAGCLSGVGTYLLGTVGSGCRLFELCQNIPLGHCWVGCFSGVGTYLMGTVGQESRLFKPCRNLPPLHCLTGAQAV